MKTDTLGHLLELESRAASLLLDAQTEADRRTAEARAQAEADYKKQYEQIVADMEAGTEKHIGELKRQYDADLDAYKTELSAYNRDTDAFDGLLKNLLFGN